MNANGWAQLILFSVILLALTKPMGLYLVRVLDAEGRTWLDPALKPVERLIYRLAGIDPAKEQDWKGYAISVLIFSLVTLLLDLSHPAAARRPAAQSPGLQRGGRRPVL